MNVRSSTAPPYRTREKHRLALWFLLVGVLAVLQYAGRFSSGKPSAQTLYEWTTAIGTVIQDGIILVLVLLIAKPRWDLLALRRPKSIARAAGYVVVTLVAIYVFEGVYGALTHPGNEQGLTPKHWESARAAPYVVNALVICTFVPFVEELTYRGLGFSVVRPWGRWPTILVVGLMFGLAHGLLVLLPVIVAFGCMLAWIRDRTDSVVPGMFAHGIFNLIALVAAVAVSH
ncbi:MAG TPA: type II CAAX endopeptidase family protein [Gaiellaceae bacterium]